MENFDCVFDCSSLQNRSAVCGSGEDIVNLLHRRWVQFESVLPKTLKDMLGNTSAPSHQFVSVEGIVSQPPKFEPGVLSSVASPTCLENRQVDGFSSEMWTVIPDYMDSGNHTSPLKSNMRTNACLGNNPSSRMLYESSQAYLKRFIMFDHSAGKGRILLHPALIQELSGDDPSTLAYLARVAQGDLFKEDQCIGINTSTYLQSFGEGNFMVTDKPIGNVLKDSVPFASKLDGRLVAYREMAASDFAKQHSMRDGKILNLMDMNGKHEKCLTFSAVETESSSRFSCTGRICDTNSSWHENSEDIDALLYSDDEVTSTGHFPDDDLGGASLCDSYSETKRRRINSSCRGNRDTTSSEGDSCEVSVVAAASLNFPLLSNPQCDPVASQKEDDHLLKAIALETCSKNESAGSQNVSNYIPCHPTTAAKARRRKIKQTVETLRKIIPGGECMDAAIVLDEAIQYLRLLQHKVQQLDARRLMDK